MASVGTGTGTGRPAAPAWPRVRPPPARRTRPRRRSGLGAHTCTGGLARTRRLQHAWGCSPCVSGVLLHAWYTPCSPLLPACVCSAPLRLPAHGRSCLVHTRGCLLHTHTQTLETLFHVCSAFAHTRTFLHAQLLLAHIRANSLARRLTCIYAHMHMFTHACLHISPHTPAAPSYTHLHIPILVCANTLVCPDCCRWGPSPTPQPPPCRVLLPQAREAKSRMEGGAGG